MQGSLIYVYVGQSSNKQLFFLTSDFSDIPIFYI